MGVVAVLVRRLFTLGLIGHMVANYRPANAADNRAYRASYDGACRGAGDRATLDTLVSGVRHAGRAQEGENTQAAGHDLHSDLPKEPMFPRSRRRRT